MGGSILSGQLTMRTGRYKIFPVFGTAILAITFFLMLTVTVDTSYWVLDVYFLMIGAGLGLCMQTMLIAVQNTVPAKDMGVATSSATFFRQLGGTLGVAVFLSLLFNSLPDKIQSALQSASVTPAFQQAVAAAAQDPNSPSHAVAQSLVAASQGNAAAGASIGDALGTDSSFLNTLDSNIARPFQVGYVDSTHLVYIIGGIIMVLAFVLVLIMKELPLRTKSALDERLEEQAQEDAALTAEALGATPEPASDGDGRHSAEPDAGSESESGAVLVSASVGGSAGVADGAGATSNGAPSNGTSNGAPSNGTSTGAPSNGAASNGNGHAPVDGGLRGFATIPADRKRETTGSGRHRA